MSYKENQTEINSQLQNSFGSKNPIKTNLINFTCINLQLIEHKSQCYLTPPPLSPKQKITYFHTPGLGWAPGRHKLYPGNRKHCWDNHY